MSYLDERIQTATKINEKELMNIILISLANIEHIPLVNLAPSLLPNGVFRTISNIYAGAFMPK